MIDLKDLYNEGFVGSENIATSSRLPHLGLFFSKMVSRSVWQKPYPKSQKRGVV